MTSRPWSTSCPIRRVAAVGRGLGSERTIAAGPHAGQTVTAAVPTTVIGALEFASGAVGGLTASFDVVASAAPHLEIQVRLGSLSLGDPNTFDGAVRYRPLGAKAGTTCRCASTRVSVGAWGWRT